MFTINVGTSFYASHQLTLPDGSKEKLHKHNWQVSVQIQNPQLNKMGLVMDFNRLKAKLENVVSDFNAVQMEEIDYFKKNNSSAENVAKYIYQKLEKKITDQLKLNYVQVTEEPGFSAKFMK